jgi:hypothetical protein
MESGPSQYKSSSEQERFSRQLNRDLGRGRLSQSTIRKLITNDTAQWARSIYDQKLSQNGATNASAQQISPTFATTQTSAIGAPSGAGIMASVASSAGASTDTAAGAEEEEGGGAGLPAGAIAKEFDICENGQPTTYWFVVWEEEPVIVPPEPPAPEE